MPTPNRRSNKSRAHIQIPHLVMETDDYRNLPANALKLLNALVYQYRGKNNGDLSATMSLMSKWGFRSKETLSNALKALLDANLIIKTREGCFMNPGGRCALFALTWRNIDECQGKHDMKPTSTPFRKFSLEK